MRNLPPVPQLTNEELDLRIAQHCHDRIESEHNLVESDNGNYYKCKRCHKLRTTRLDRMPGPCIIHRYSTRLDDMNYALCFLPSALIDRYMDHLMTVICDPEYRGLNWADLDKGDYFAFTTATARDKALAFVMTIT